MENRPVPKFTVGDAVIYQNIVFEIVSIHFIDWLRESDNFVYEMAVLGSSFPEPPNGRLLIVREGLLNKATDRDVQIWRILYGKL